MKAAYVAVLVASSAFAQNPDLVPHAQPACGPMNVQFQVKTDSTQHPDAQPEAGKALVYVVEEQKFRVFRDVTVRVGLDGEWVGATRGTSYLAFTVEPGEHHLCVDFLSDFLTPGRLISLFGLNAEPGKLYYFRARTTASGGNASRHDIASLELDLLNDDQGRLLVANAPLSISHPKNSSKAAAGNPPVE